MNRVLIAARRCEDCAALRRLFLDLKVEVVAAVCSYQDALRQASALRPTLIVIEWGLMQAPQRSAIDELRAVCPPSTKIVLLSRLDARKHAALASGADEFISKQESAESMVERFRSLSLSP